MQESCDVITVILSCLKLNVVLDLVDKYEIKLMSDFITVFDSKRFQDEFEVEFLHLSVRRC